MPNVERKYDPNTAGGRILGPCAPTVITNGRPTSLVGDLVSPHPPCGIHCAARTTVGSPSVIAEGLPVIRVIDIDTCGHKRSDPSPDVFAE